MFDTVPRSKFEVEQTARITAEQRANSLSLVVQSLTIQVEQLGKLLENQSKLHHAAQTDLLDRYEPKPGTPRLPDDTKLQAMTADEIRAQPAATRQEMFKRDRLAREAEKREQQEAEKKATNNAGRAIDKTSLPPGEAARLANIIASTLEPATQ